MPGIGLPEMLIVAVIALLVLGPKRLPEAGRGLGRGLREFKDGITGRQEHAPAELPASPTEPPHGQAAASERAQPPTTR